MLNIQLLAKLISTKMNAKYLIILIIQVIIVASAKADYNDVDIPFLSKLRYKFRELPKQTQCKLLVQRIKEQVGDSTAKSGNVLVQVRDRIKVIESIAKPGLVKYLDGCIEEIGQSDREVTVRQGESPGKIGDELATEQQQQSPPSEQIVANSVDNKSEDEASVEKEKETNIKLSNELESLKVKQEKTEAENESLRHQLSETGSSSEGAKNEAKRLKAKLDERGDEIESLKQQLADAKNKNAEIVEEMEKLREDINESCAKVQRSEEEKNKLTEVASSSEQYKAQVLDLNKTNNDIKEELTGCLDERLNLINEIKSVKSECERKLGSVRQQLNAALERASDAEKDRDSYASSLNSARNELNQWKSRFGYCQPIYYNCGNNGR